MKPWKNFKCSQLDFGNVQETQKIQAERKTKSGFGKKQNKTASKFVGGNKTNISARIKQRNREDVA